MDDIVMEHLRIEFERDDMCSDPMEDHEDLKLVSFHPRYGNRHCFNDADELKRYAREHGCRLFEVYVYDHSGLAFSLEPFSCGWDSGLYGYLMAENPSSMSSRAARKLRSRNTSALSSKNTTHGNVVTAGVIESLTATTTNSTRAGGYIGEDYVKLAAIEDAQCELARIDKARQHKVKQLIPQPRTTQSPPENHGGFHMKVSVRYTETVVRAGHRRNRNRYTTRRTQAYDTLEHEARQQVFDEVQEYGWDYEDTLDNRFELKEDNQ